MANYIAVTPVELRDIYRVPWHLVETKPRKLIRNGVMVQVLCGLTVEQQNWSEINSTWMAVNGLRFCNGCLLALAEKESSP